jgi:Na+/H+ antiporter NhaD/arsenite permease-like protein
VLSAILDNAPTYLVFFKLAGGNASELMTSLSAALAAISMGAVYMGALTYIGNAPNFMIYAIATERGVSMPSFFGYIIWSVIVLGPVFVGVTYLFVMGESLDQTWSSLLHLLQLQ